MEPLRIVIADDEPIIRLDMKRMLESVGYAVVGEAGDGVTALELARELKPDVVVLDVKMPNMDGLEVAQVLEQEQIAPALIVTAYSDSELINRAKEAGVFAYIVKPFKESDLQPAVEIAVSRYQENIELSKEVADLTDRIETRKLVDRAKGILMDMYNLKEHEAYRRIQTQSMNTRKTMREIAEAIILAHGV
jgi:two-component system, response regulator PdtaR